MQGIPVQVLFPFLFAAMEFPAKLSNHELSGRIGSEGVCIPRDSKAYKMLWELAMEYTREFNVELDDLGMSKDDEPQEDSSDDDKGYDLEQESDENVRWLGKKRLHMIRSHTRSH